MLLLAASSAFAFSGPAAAPARTAVRMITKEAALETLGVSRNADAADLKKAFRAASRELHPDAQHGTGRREVAAEQFAEFNEVYNELLLDVEKKKEAEIDARREM